MAFWRRISQSKLTHNVPYASMLNPTCSISKPCLSDNPFLSDFLTKVRFFAAPVQANQNSKKTDPGANGPLLNQSITASFVRLVMGEDHFVISRNEALERARKLELDLVQVQGTANPPVCKIMDYHKEKYKKETREKEHSKNKSVKTLRPDSKEVKFSPKTESNDLKMKADMVKRFLEKGYRVKVTASDSEGQDLRAVFSRLIAMIEEMAYIEGEPTPGKGKESFIMARHVKFGPPKKGVKKTKAEEKRGPEKDSDDDIEVATRADSVPLPIQEHSDEAEKYRKIEARNQFSPTRDMDNKGDVSNQREPHIPYQRREAPTNSPFSSPTRETKRAETNSSAASPNSIPNPKPSTTIPRRPPRSPGLGYGIFSNPTGNASSSQGVSERVPASTNSPNSRP